MPTAPLELVRLAQLSGVDMVEVFGRAPGQEAPPPELDQELFDPEFECSFVASAAGRTTYHGLEGFAAGWRDWLEPWASYRVDLEDLIPAGERVVALVHVRARSARDGVEMEHSPAAIWTVAGDRLVSVEFHLERDSAMRAVGLEDRVR